MKHYHYRTLSYDLSVGYRPPLLLLLPQAPSPICLHFVVPSRQTGTSNTPVNVRWHKLQLCVYCLWPCRLLLPRFSWECHLAWGLLAVLSHTGSSHMSLKLKASSEHLEWGKGSNSVFGILGSRDCSSSPWQYSSRLFQLQCSVFFCGLITIAVNLWHALTDIEREWYSVVVSEWFLIPVSSAARTNQWAVNYRSSCQLFWMIN